MESKINLPNDIEIAEYIGRGGRAHAYNAYVDSEPVIIKIYHEEVAQKYAHKYQVDIAKYEYGRNVALYELPKIKRYIAKPYRVFPQDGEFTHCMVQERVTGQILKQVIVELGCLPSEILESGYEIVREAEANGIHDLDISVGNVLVNKASGKWIPKLYDFNIMPQYLFPPNPIVGLAFKLGIRKKSFRDYRSLRNWDRRGKQKKWIGRN
ncbi:MAG: hypothetical protein GKR92_07715 [Gammaproteobacteria bacterium]|nr:MAG: hypothetical protein GKR92_07715 [Gammaproteobacteria bacterium]